MSNPRRLRYPVLILSVLLAGAAASAAPDRIPSAPRWEVGFLAGAGLSDGDLQGGPYGMGSVGPVYGIRGARLVGRRFLWFGDLTVAEFPTDLAEGNAERVAVRTGLDLLLGTPGKWNWFASAAAGYAEVDFAKLRADFHRPLASLGGGQRFALRNGTLLRWELRGEALLGNSGLRGDGVQNVELLVGWGIPLGRAGSGGGHDADRDGVPDRRDRCAFTPLGSPVDERGCAIDSDGDRVPDGVDKCPGTPSGARVGSDGCPTDFDRDGVPDGIDTCARTPRGARVDEKGCPLDADGDGVPDGLDRCLDTPAEERVDSVGCPPDSDGDGVPDKGDTCPDTPRGARVDAAGCPSDTDRDGVPDGTDRCPDSSAGAHVGSDGCEAPSSGSSRIAALAEGRGSLVLEGTHFAVGRAELDPESQRILVRVAAALGERRGLRVEIGGHTDATGSEESNFALSRRRAEAVRDFLASEGVDRARLVAIGYGASRPVADNETPEGRAQNRRVELTPLR